MQNETPLRQLVKSYANGLLDRDQYLEIRKKLLNKLSRQGELAHDDFSKFLQQQQKKEIKKEIFWSSYSISDWIIIVLGFMAATTLAIFLYT
ncbi:MAG: hypothetical protein GY744_05080 [Gammaproteobacteria bacterium]|nr:hypothetical protein [Gammaproteobacteria bacterium]